MTTVMTTSTATGTEHESRAPLALRMRRAALVAMPVLAGLFAVVAAAADPAAGITGDAMTRLYADNPGPLQLKSLGFHWSYAFWIAPALLLARYVTGRGRALANVAAALGFVGMTTLPGLLFVDWMDSAIGQQWGVDGVNTVHQTVESSMWGFPLFQVPGLAGFMLALPIAALALWRAGLVRWWAPLAVVLGYAAFLLSNVTWPGCVATTICFTVFAVALERATRAGAVAP